MIEMEDVLASFDRVDRELAGYDYVLADFLAATSGWSRSAEKDFARLEKLVEDLQKKHLAIKKILNNYTSDPYEV